MSVALLAPAGANAAIGGEFAAQADGGQLYVDAVNFNALTAESPVDSLTTIGLSPTQAQVASPGGLGGGVISRGFGQNLDLSMLDTTVPLDLSTAEQTAPPDHAEPIVAQMVPLDDAAPLLTGAVSESTAWARDPAAVECPDQDGRTTISEGTSTTTDLGVLEIEEGTSLISVRDASGEGTLTSASGTYVGSEGQVIAESVAQGAALNLGGELDIEVLNPTLTATATGTPGGATVEYTGEVRVNGEKIAGVQENQISLDALADVLTPVDEQILNELFGPIDEQVLEQLEVPLSDALAQAGISDLTLPDLVDLINNETIELDEVGGLEPIALVTAGQLENVQEAADGTRASGEVKTVRVEVNVVSELAGTEVPILTFHLMPLAVDAQAPAGGLDCGAVAADQDPFANLGKDASTTVVAPGDTFEYQITVPNDAACTVTGVTVTDTVTGPDGFAIVASEPRGTIDGDTISWDLDELAPGAEETFTLTVQVPSTAEDGESFDDEVTANGTCDDQPVTGEFLLPDVPTVSTGQGTAPDSPSSTDSLPRTGGGTPLLGLAALGAASRLRRRS